MIIEKLLNGNVLLKEDNGIVIASFPPDMVLQDDPRFAEGIVISNTPTNQDTDEGYCIYPGKVTALVENGTSTPFSGNRQDLILKLAQNFFFKLMVARGIITMWSGQANNIPAGWLLCDGQNGTPDLRSRFVVGYDPRDADYNAVGKTGGSKAVALTTNEMPSHNHGMSESGNHTHGYSVPPQGDQNYKGGGGNTAWGNNWRNWETGAAGKHTHAISNTGGGQAHENRPPFYALAFIMKN